MGFIKQTNSRDLLGHTACELSAFVGKIRKSKKACREISEEDFSDIKELTRLAWTLDYVAFGLSDAYSCSDEEVKNAVCDCAGLLCNKINEIITKYRRK